MGADDQHHSMAWNIILIRSAPCTLVSPAELNAVELMELTMFTQGRSLMHLSMIKAGTYLEAQARW